MKTLFDHMTEKSQSRSWTGDYDADFEPQAGEGFLPTTAWAGSEEKIEVMARRVEKGLPIFHPDDCQFVQVPTNRQYCRSDSEYRARESWQRKFIQGQRK